MSTSSRESESRFAFTVMELLVVIAILSLLVAILIPAVVSSRNAAAKARTRTQFAQWASAIESFRSEYGFYPSWDPANKVNSGVTAADHPFHDVLAGRKRDGSALTSGSLAASQNKKNISFQPFRADDFGSEGSAGLLCDGFGDTEIAVLCDRNLDGVINAAEYGDSLPAVHGITPALADFPAEGVRAGVVFYAAAPNATVDDPRLIMNWK